MTRASEFAAVRSRGRSAGGAYLVLAKLERPDLEDGTFRAGFITPKRIGKAVHRNRVRRRLREIVRDAGGRGLLPEKFALVTIARHRSVGVPLEKLRKEWMWLARKIEVLGDGRQVPPAGPPPKSDG